MDEQPQDSTQVEAAAPPAKKRGFGKVILFAVVALVVLGGGGAWWMSRGTGAAAAGEPVDVSPEARGLVTFEPFLVNLSDAGGTRFLKVTLDLVLATAEEAAHVDETPVIMRQIRSAILELLTQQSATSLVTPEGKQKLKDAIKTRIAELPSHHKVIDVLFAEFVVQF